MYYYQTHYIRAEFRRFPLPEIAGNLNRPECGWYQLYSYNLIPDTKLSDEDIYLNISDGSGYTYRLALLEFNLSGYADRDIDAAAKSNIEQVFQNFSNSRMKLIIRFLYDWNGNGMENEPEKRAHVKNHMEQISELLNEYKDQIYTTQGIFIGSWAEMHNSKYLSAEDITTLILTYAKYTDDSIFLAVRTPEQYRTIFEELEKSPDKYSEYGVTADDLKKRLGLFNDGLFGSMSDLGTYEKVEAATSELEKQNLRQEELDFQNTLCMHVPNGGEVVGDNSLSDGETALNDLRSMHFSYLNHVYDLKVIDKWKKEPVKNMGKLYEGKTYYDYITDHLGARFVLEDCEIKYKPLQTGKAKGSLTLTNKGFSSLYFEKNFTLRLIHEKTKKEITIFNTDDLDNEQKTTSWLPDVTIEIPFSFSPFDLEEGDYDLIATLNDPDTDERISFANDCYETDADGYMLGILTISY